MRARLLLTILFGFAISTAQAAVPEQSFAPVADKAMPAVVEIMALKIAGKDDPLPRPFDVPKTPGEKMTALGAGFVIDPTGYIVTNNHVVESSKEIAVQISGVRYEAKLIGTDPRFDVALIKVEGTALPFLQFGDSDTVKIGDWVIAIGNPFGLGKTVTSGIISAKHRPLKSDSFDDYMQLDASINQGNSGGPTLNMQGEVIGMNTAIFSPSGGSVGIGFAIPSNEIKVVVEKLQATGHSYHGKLGVQIQPISDDLAKALDLKSTKGAIVAIVSKGSPAATAGVKSGDVIVKLGDKPVNEVLDVTRTVIRMNPGADLTLGILRNNKPMTLKVTVGKIDVPEAPEATKASTPKVWPELGIHVAAIASEDPRAAELGGVGVNTVGVEKDSPASGMVSVDDIILQIGSKTVHSEEEFKKFLEEVRSSGKPVALKVLTTDGITAYLALKFTR